MTPPLASVVDRTVRRLTFHVLARSSGLARSVKGLVLGVCLVLALDAIGVASVAQAQSCQDFSISWGGAGTDSAFQVTQNSNGDLLLGGVTDSFGAGSFDGLLMRYDPMGNLIWSRTWGTTGEDYFLDVLEDSSGNLFVGGGTRGTGACCEDILLLKYDSSGTLLWRKAWGGSSDEEGALSITANGEVYVGGETRSFAGNGADVLLLKYDSSGSFVWAKTWDGGNDEGINGSCISANSLYVAGNTRSFTAGTDALLQKYDLSGNLIWSKTWGTASGQDDAFGVAADNSGNVFVLGTTDSPGNGNQPFLAKFDSQGSLLWDLVWQGDDPGSITTDAGGNAYVSAQTPPVGSSTDAILLKFTPTGQLDWARSWVVSSSDAAFGRASVTSGVVNVPLVTSSCGGSWQDRSRSTTDPNIGVSSVSGTFGVPPSADFVPNGTVTFPVGSTCTASNEDVRLLRRGSPTATMFCTAKTGLVCGAPSICASGNPSATASTGFTISAQPARSCRSGVLLYNLGSAPGGPYPPFGGTGNGVLCVKAQGLKRAAPIESGGTPGPNCDGVFALDMNAFNTANWASTGCNPALGQTNPAGFLGVPGNAVHAQIWGRDSTSTGQFLSDGVAWVQGP